jgi:hypothetical protein
VKYAESEAGIKAGKVERRVPLPPARLTRGIARNGERTTAM